LPVLPSIAVPEASGDPAAPTILSSVRLNQLRATLPADTLANLVEECLFDLSKRLTVLLEAVRQQASEQIVAHAHAMAGMSAEYGMGALEVRLRALMRIMPQAPSSVGVLADGLETEVVRAAAAMREGFHIEIV